MAVHLVDANALFVHIPKTGGVWVEEALPASGIATACPLTTGGVSWRHPLPADIRGSFDFTFTFVRHPITWYESWWRFASSRVEPFEPGVWHPQRTVETYAKDGFSTFIRRCIEHQPSYVTRLYEWYVGPPGVERIDLVGRQEELVDTLVRVLHELAYEFDETVLRAHPPENTTASFAGEILWDPDLRRQILELEAPAIERFYDGRDEPPGSGEGRAPARVRTSRAEGPLRLGASGPGAPELSVVVVAYDIPRELPRTLTSLSPGYQLHIDPGEYEVIVVDNGSEPAIDVTGAADNVRVIRIDDAASSPAAAINRGLAEARGEVIAVMIDGARLASPALLHFGLQAARLYEKAVVASLGWYIGFDYQRLANSLAHDTAAEDVLLGSIGWPADGYRLFEIATMDESSVDGWFPPIAESNCLFLSRSGWDRLGGVDERFVMPGGGLLNLDTFRRAIALPDAELVILLGEATFHQHHGGTATGLSTAEYRRMWDEWAAEYESIRGEPYGSPPSPPRPPSYVGTLPSPVLERFARAIVKPSVRQAPLGEEFDPARWSAVPWSPPADGATAGLIELVHQHLSADRLTAATAVTRLARARDPDEPELRRLGSLLAAWMPFGEPFGRHQVEYHLALGEAHRVLGDRAQGAAEFRAALELDRDLPAAHIGLSQLLLPGESYHSWLERIYAFLAPDSVLEIGVADGRSLATVRSPTIAIGVDPAPSAMVPLSADAHLFRETSDEFFDAHRLDRLLGGPLDVAFIDGDHLYEQALKDFVNVERHCGPGSLVILHDTIPLDEATQSRGRETAFHSGDVWKVVLCLRHFRPELDVVTVATPWTGLTLVSGFAGEDSGFARRYDEAVARFIDMPYSALGDDPLSALDVIPNDWDLVRPRLERLRRRVDGVDADSRQATAMRGANGSQPHAGTAIGESLRNTQLELMYTQQQRQRIDSELVAIQAHVLELNEALDAAEASVRRIEQSVVWQTFQRVRRRVFAACGGDDSRAVRAIQSSLRRAGRALDAGSRWYVFRR
jgi:hypothetical protein